MPLVMRDEVTVLLTQRPSHMSSHAGQIAFPGGKIDATDANAIAAALRETHEEVGIESHFIQVLEELPVYTTGSGFLVTPVLGLLEDGFSLAPNPSEVSDVFEVPLRFLMDPAHHRRHAVEWAGMRREWLSMPYVDGNIERFIWGATAGMLRNLYGYMLA
jgi:8-oxo-dGTP pyrophosphatase MutT (NUDIX family)